MHDHRPHNPPRYHPLNYENFDRALNLIDVPLGDDEDNDDGESRAKASGEVLPPLGPVKLLCR